MATPIDFRSLGEFLAQQLKQYPTAKRYLIGYSGGLDSQVLLTAISELDLPQAIRAVHINHGLQSESHQWQQHCATYAADQGIEFISLAVDARAPRGESPEAWARQQRYAAFSQLLESGDVLLLAHHQDDQVETFFLHLLRGSGSHGLAAMPAIRDFDSAYLARPFLSLPRSVLVDYANHKGLKWIEDPSNQQTQYDRNYLRQKVLPEIKKRWPNYTDNIYRASVYQSEARDLLERKAALDLATLIDEEKSILSISGLIKLDDVAQRNVLRFWIKQAGFSTPSRQIIDQIMVSMLAAEKDRSPLLEWSGAQLRRYRNRLFLMSPIAAVPETCNWDLQQDLDLPTGQLTIKRQLGQGFMTSSGKVQIRFRQGGEKIKLCGQKHHQSLKKYLQTLQIPPWQRARLPLLYEGDQLIAIAHLCVMESHQVTPSEEGYVVEWRTQE